MQELDDNALLRDYVEHGSGEAFATLVERHINKVYSVALRRTGNPHSAEEITQAVFVILTQKARGLGRQVILSGWLYQTAKWTALTFLRGEIRRARREQEAHMQTALNDVESDDIWQQVAPALEDAMSALNETDRHAIVLRYFDGKSMRDVAMALGANENAAKMRVGRALEKLQKFFHRRGVTSTTETLAGAIAAHSVQPAPVALAKTITAIALAKGAAASFPVMALAKTTLLTMTLKTKTIVAASIIGALILGASVTGLYVHAKLARFTFASKNPPLTFENSVFKQDGDKDGFFTVDFDTNTLRTSTSAPAIHIKGPIDSAPGGAQFPDPNNHHRFWNSDNSSSTICVVGPGSPLLGKHICLTGWLKTRDAQNWASAFLLIATKEARTKGWSRVDSMSDRPIVGTTDWQQVKFVTDVPDEPCVVYFGPDLYGPGELWGDDFQISLADPDDPITDNRVWRQAITTSQDYPMTTDLANGHDGSPSLCFTYSGPANAAGKKWTWYGHSIRYPESEQYAGHTVRMSGWIKTENVSNHVQPQIRPLSGLMQRDSKRLANDSMVHDKSIRGTMNWTPFSVTCDIPKDTGHIETSFIFWGGGKVWIDTNSLALDIVK